MFTFENGMLVVFVACLALAALCVFMAEKSSRRARELEAEGFRQAAEILFGKPRTKATSPPDETPGSR